MENNPPVDNAPPNHDNSGIYDENGVQHFNISEHKPLNDPNCQHENVIEDKTEELGRAFQCADCKIGWILA
jgi:hypothetical protein